MGASSLPELVRLCAALPDDGSSGDPGNTGDTSPSG